MMLRVFRLLAVLALLTEVAFAQTATLSLPTTTGVSGTSITIPVKLVSSESISAGLQYSWKQSTSAGEPDVQEISPYLGIRLSERIGVTPYAIAGLSASSVLGGAGVSLTLQF